MENEYMFISVYLFIELTMTKHKVRYFYSAKHFDPEAVLPPVNSMV